MGATINSAAAVPAMAAMAAAATQAGNVAAAAAATDADSSPAATGYATPVPSPTPDHPFMRTSRRHATGYPLLFTMPDPAVLRDMWHKAIPRLDFITSSFLMGAGLAFATQVLACASDYLKGNFLVEDAGSYFLGTNDMILGTLHMPLTVMCIRWLYHGIIPEPTRANQTTLNTVATAMKRYGLGYLGGMLTQVDGISQYVDSNVYMQGMLAAGVAVPFLSLAVASVYAKRWWDLFDGGQLFEPPHTSVTAAEQAPPAVEQAPPTAPQPPFWVSPFPARIGRRRTAFMVVRVGDSANQGARTRFLDQTPQQAEAVRALQGPIQLPELPPIPVADKTAEAASGQAAATIAELLRIEAKDVNAAIGEIDRVTPMGLAILNRCREDEVLRVALAAALEAHRRQDNASASTNGAAMKVRMAHRPMFEID